MIGSALGSVYLFEQNKQASVNKSSVPVSEVQKFREELVSQNGGNELLNDIDNEKNPKVTAKQFANTARQFYLLRKSCNTEPGILTEPHFEIGLAVYNEGDKDLLITKSKGLTEVNNLDIFNKSPENLNIQCNTLAPYIDANLSELVLTGR